MAIKIGSNISSLQAQRRLGEASSSLSNIYARLSSGQRINRPSDDAAGAAIADALRSNSRVYSRGLRNVSDGVSALTIADSAVGELAAITTRILELTEQAGSGSYSYNQRQALDKEAQAIKAEYLRVIQSPNLTD